MLAEFQVTPCRYSYGRLCNCGMRVELANPSPFPAFSNSMRWPAQSFTSAIARVIVATFLFCRFEIGKMDGQSMEIDPVPRVLTLEGNLIFANRTLLAQNEELPLSPEQFNPDPGASQRVEPEAPPELFPPVLPQLPEYGEEPLPRSLELPRKGVREVVPRRTEIGIRDLPAIRTRRRFAAGLAAGAEPLVHRFRSLETLRRSINRDAVSIRIATLASLLAKQIQRGRADLRPGHFPQHHRGGFLSV